MTILKSDQQNDRIFEKNYKKEGLIFLTSQIQIKNILYYMRDSKSR